MNEELKALIAYRLEQADESLESAAWQGPFAELAVGALHARQVARLAAERERPFI